MWEGGILLKKHVLMVPDRLRWRPNLLLPGRVRPSSTSRFWNSKLTFPANVNMSPISTRAFFGHRRYCVADSHGGRAV